MFPLGNPIPAEEISDLVERFYAKVQLDPVIGPVFTAAVEDWPTHLRTLKDFWSTVLLTDARYKGDPLSIHLDLPLEPAHFRRWLAIFAETAREVMPPAHADWVIMKSERIARNFQEAIAYRAAQPPESSNSPI